MNYASRQGAGRQGARVTFFSQRTNRTGYRSGFSGGRQGRPCSGHSVSPTVSAKSGFKQLALLCAIIFAAVIFLARGGAAQGESGIQMLPITDTVQAEAAAVSLELVQEGGEAQEYDLSPVNLPGKSVTLQVYIHTTGQTVTMELETYLTGVVAAEMPALFETEALKAQAVAARTYVYYRLQNGKCGREGADICTDSSHCQAWLSQTQQKSLWGEDFSVYQEKIYEAVYGTAGEILTYEGKPINALYHAVSGGQTEDCGAVFAQSLPYLVSVSSPGEQADANYQSQVSFTKTELARKLNTAFPAAKVTAAGLQSQCKVSSYTDSGRVNRVQLGKTTVSASQLREALGLKSTLFTIQFSGDTVIFSVKGYGHGVGMSQRGADAMAEAGSTYAQILAHYYQGTKLAQTP